ncbi:neprilysin-1-like [Haemaphysalis longicornis]
MSWASPRNGPRQCTIAQTGPCQHVETKEAASPLEDILSRNNLLLVVLATLASTVVVVFAPAFTRGHFPACNDPRCMNLSADLRLMMREDVRPCDDFFAFVCGNYEAAYGRVPSYADAVGKRVRRSFREMIRELVVDFSDKVEDIPLVAYRKCMDEFHRKEDDLGPIREYDRLLNATLNNIPDGNYLFKNVYFLVALSLKFGTPVFLRAGVVRDTFRQRENALQLEAEKARKPLPRVTLHKIILQRWGFRHWRDYLRHSDVILEVMTGAAGALDEVHLNHSAPQAIVADNIDRFLPTMKPHEFVGVIRAVSSESFGYGNIVFTTNALALRKLAGFLKSTHPAWLGYSARFLACEALLVASMFSFGEIYDIPKPAAAFRYRLLRCTDLSLGLLSPLTEYQFIQKWLGQNSSAVSERMITTLLEQLPEVKPYALMEEASRANLSTMLARTTIFRGLYPGYSTAKDVQSRFARLKFPKGSFVTWARHALKTKAELQVEALMTKGIPPVRADGLDLHLGVLYDASEYSLRVQPAQLLPPFGASLSPSAFSFGHLGTSVAEALAQATEPRSLSGNPAKLSFSPAYQDKYMEAVDCVRRQYLEGEQELLDVEMAAGQLSSLIGLRVAYKAWEAWKEQGTSAGPRRALPHVHSDEQEFFVGFCLRHCGVATTRRDNAPGSAETVVSRPARCNMPLKLSSEFARAFKCADSDRMTARGQHCA